MGRAGTGRAPVASRVSAPGTRALAARAPHHGGPRAGVVLLAARPGCPRPRVGGRSRAAPRPLAAANDPVLAVSLDRRWKSGPDLRGDARGGRRLRLRPPAQPRASLSRAHA